MVDLQASNAALSRRTFVRGLGAGGLILAAPQVWFQSDQSSSSPPEQLHLQFGEDASREVVVSWATATNVAHPRLRLGTHKDGFGRTVEAETRTYVDGLSGVESFTQHVRLRGLEPGGFYTYEVLHDGVEPESGSFETAPKGRAPLRFTSFGDQATPEAGNGLASIWSSYNPPQVEKMQPLFHLLNGDLCYANISPDRPATWRDFFLVNEVSARFRPWMPAAGNHENELNNGPHGYLAYQTRFSVPDNGERDPALRGMWYTFTAGSVRVVSINNDDVCLQDGGDSYVRGYSQGAQMRFLKRTLRQANKDDDVDWIVVCMHQVAISSAINFNGADLGIRQAWLPLFDKYGVDLVVCGHEHHFERTLAVRGVDPASIATLRPRVADTSTDVVDTSKGTVHMVIGGGGTSAPSNQLLLDPPQCQVIVAVGQQLPTPPGGARPHRASIKVTEDATWVGSRDKTHSYGFASFDVDPNVGKGRTQMHVRVWDTAPSTNGIPTLFDEFILERPRRDRDQQRGGGNAEVASLAG
jgi:3',5'-cyclic AMP phosphodiesterase CpdA